MQDCPDIAELRDDCLRSNMALLQSLNKKADGAALTEELYGLACKDAALGRMSWPLPASTLDLEGVRLNPRFAVVQGEKEDGTPKVRAIDHLSWSAPQDGVPMRERTRKRQKLGSVNGHVSMPEQIQHEHLDDLFAATRVFMDSVGELPELYKADIDAAFRLALFHVGPLSHATSRFIGGSLFARIIVGQRLQPSIGLGR